MGTAAPIDEVWGRDEAPVQSEVPTVSARVQRLDPPVLSDIELLRMDIMERLSTFLICIMGALTVILLHMQKLRREIRLLREGILRPLM